jgi:ATP-dependent Clp protease protease subunit
MHRDDFRGEEPMSDPMDDAVNSAQKMALVEGTLLKNRVITLFGEIDKDSARRTNEKLLALSFESSDPITLIISSPGGHVESGDSIYDMIRFVGAPVRIVGTGWVGSAGALIYLAAEKENRYSLPNTRYLMHQPAGGFGGQASDIEIHAREIIKMRERLNATLAERTGQTIERIAEDTDRDFWMSAEEAKEIPTEVSEPPYEVGELPSEQGYYLERADAPSINFRIVGNKIRIYWIDADGLIAEPETAAGSVRFTGSVRGRPYHRVELLSDDAGLGAKGIIPPPHIYNVILTLEKPDSDELDSFSFRYIATMDSPVDPPKSEKMKERSTY